MSRFFFFAVLLACVFCVLQAVPVPDDPQQPATNDLDNLAAEAKKVLDGAKDLLANVDLSETMQSAKAYLGQAGENIRKELEKMTEKVQG